MGEEEIIPARGAHSQIGDVFCRNAGGEQLAAVGLGEIEKNFLRHLSMTGRACAEKKQWVFFVDLVPFFRFPEEFSSVAELRFEYRLHLRSDLITAAANSRANRRTQIGRSSSKPAVHLAHTFFDDPLNRSAPAGMKDAYGPVLGIDQNHGKAIGGQNTEQDSRSVGYQAIAGKRIIWDLTDQVNDVGVDLAEGQKLW